MKKKILILTGIILVLILAYAFYQFNKSHVDMDTAKPIAILKASDLFTEYDINENSANQLYLGKIVQVTGIIYSVEVGHKGDINVLIMGDDDMFGVACNFNLGQLNDSDLNKGDHVIIKGECAGMLSDVVLIRCVIVKNK